MSSKKSEKERKDKIFKELSAVINNDQSARYFCDVLEAVFLHGLKNPKSLWPCLALLIPENIKLVLSALRNSQSDIWKCRAWLRLALVKGRLLEFFETLQKHTTTLQTHYSIEAFLRDPELCEVVLQLLKGVAGF
ncbi:pleckstrin homology domain-containing family M member 1-like isoform X1 [Dysidea avara]|uniref:pleckstrin homology domain-containing family M member 1-like isoform X1 n=1 Tax=Dysidea avara TaxID=196820 RepID=UPI00332D9613